MVALNKFALVGVIAKDPKEIGEDISFYIDFIIKDFETGELYSYSCLDFLGGETKSRSLMNNPDYRSVKDLGIKWDVFVDPSTRRVMQSRNRIYLGDFRIGRKIDFEEVTLTRRNPFREII
ncbi:hypothetical protein COU60_01270 [Candidatus Pacearchaeota archaeon CG10_big_fil_rev_8_21_14_0_10_34_76]|nr:MAG: hypothetical protein COU60_01270 [Candidatus Pacearchaeota archaeon CG10_big_fil_rev_8_21_14_0_10_34_76]